MENCIYDSNNNDTIGFYKDIRAGLKKQAEEFIKSDDFEMAQEIANLLLDLEAYTDNERLLVLSDNNGMGYTINEYKGE